ncbi:serine/threonine-protein phosphatase 4 regulatory subunit 3 isoform X2 [Episyrphus balteatus]|uniref:serine/threonine-protein phosphatase 4 regulatory subunit 3 isoform X2 n=1 Tax=Episyrphus balteatus TaxID=286459 RepID=UPI002486A24B|nr:serine/threonine-protein phosphatase 4 regulatory subunit 3 isoform X2 [Episyrphus balteatus]
MTTDTRRRVKLYALNAERQWDDRGTGHVSSNYVDRLKGISLLVRAESDGSLLLESKIQPDTAYQKQQDTLIVWSEGDNFDLALSFQEKVGCDEIWEKICQVQGKDPSVEITQDIVEESEDERFEDMSDTAPPIELPPCELGRLEDIAETIQNCLTTPLRKEKLSTALQSENYIKKLLNLFHVCEDLENMEGLHHLFEIFKNIFLLNKNALFEIMFAEDTIFDVVGCLEYDPNLTQPKKHRQYLKQLAKFREAIPIRNQDLLAKIHQTFRVQYIQDIILPTPSVFVEDNMLNTLSSFIFFNKVEIVTLIQEDERFLVDMFTLLTDPNTSEAKRRDIVLFLKEFCNYAQNLQPPGKDSFYKTLTCLGILQALEITLIMADQKTKSASIDILTAIVEFSPLVVRNYTLQQVSRTDGGRMLLNIAIEQMLTDSEPELGGAVQLMGVIKILLEPENMLTEKGDFLNFFYKHSIQTLIAPLLMNTISDRPQNEDYQTAQLLGLVLDILSFCVEHHTYHIKNFIIQKDLLKRILVLMKSTHTFLVLGALRLLRKIIALKDEFYNRHIVKGNLFAPVVDAFIRNNGRYNLLESAILELFEYIKLEDIKTLCVYFVENFSKIFDEIEYVQTFKYLKTRYDQYQDRIKDRDKLAIDSTLPIIRSGRYRRDQRQLDEDEEMWFNEEEDFAEELDSYNVMKIEKNGPQSAQQNKSPNNSSTAIHSMTNSSSLNTSSTSLSPGSVSGSSSSSGSSTASSSPPHSSNSPPQGHNASLSMQQHPLHNFQQQQVTLTSTQQQQSNQQNAAALVISHQQQELSLSSSSSNSSSSSSSSSSESLSQQQKHQQQPQLKQKEPQSQDIKDKTTTIITNSSEIAASSQQQQQIQQQQQNTHLDPSSSSSSSSSEEEEATSASSLKITHACSKSDIDGPSNISTIITTGNTTSTTNRAAADAVSAVVAAIAASTTVNSTNCDGILNVGAAAAAVAVLSAVAANGEADAIEKETALALTAATANSSDNVIKKGLVDYESDSNEEYDDEDEDMPDQKKPRLA